MSGRIFSRFWYVDELSILADEEADSPSAQYFMTPPRVIVIPLVQGIVFSLVEDFGRAVGFGFGVSKIFGMYICLDWHSPFSSSLHSFLAFLVHT